jgi:cell division protein FtsL
MKVNALKRRRRQSVFSRKSASGSTRRHHQRELRRTRPELRTAKNSTPRRRRQGPAPDRHLRLALLTTAVLTVGTIFGAAAFHVLLVQSQFRLDRLKDTAATEQQRYEHLRLEVARLSAPERIVATAAERLGMVVPPEVAYLPAPSPPGNDPSGTDPSSASSLAGNWSEVKPYLAARP